MSESVGDGLTKATRLSVFFTPGSVRKWSHEEAEFLVKNVCPPFLYVIPSFDIISVELRQLKVVGQDEDGNERAYDLFIRNYDTITPPLPAILLVKDITVIKEEEFQRSVNTDNLAFFPFGVVVVWDWEWEATESNSEDSETNSPCHDQSQLNYHMNTDESDTNSDIEIEPVEKPIALQGTHVVTFKCMGTLFEQSRQNALKEVADTMRCGGSIPVKLVPEPENKFDSKAIAFFCELKGKWFLIGYIVRDVLDEVHKAIKEEKIVSVKFAWAKYRVVWMRSGPGYYAGIDICLNGKWPRIVMQHASTH